MYYRMSKESKRNFYYKVTKIHKQNRFLPDVLQCVHFLTVLKGIAD